ncbi:MAG: DUF2161 domain-containing phosphodiesterase [Halocynthiibacter sp.]
MLETDLYAPVKTFLETLGYDVKSEVEDCDVVAVRGDDPPVVVELKLTLNLALFTQAIDRQSMTDAVYIAVPHKKGRAFHGALKGGKKLCRRLGLGLIVVQMARKTPVVTVAVDPSEFKPRKLKKRKDVLLGEFYKRQGDFNTGGQNKRMVMTAYRQDALRVAQALQGGGPNRPAILRDMLDVPKAAPILQDNHYGWFFRVERGIYDLTETGHGALITHRNVLDALNATEQTGAPSED